MKTRIYYFSGTGNSLSITKGLAKELPGEVELLPIAACKKKTEFDGEVIGLVYPVYNLSLPNIVRSFLEEVKFNNKAYIFAVATCNGEPGHSLFTLDRLLKRKGRSLDLGMSVVMPGNAILNPPEVQKERLANAQIKLTSIAQAIIKRQQDVIEGNNAAGTYLKGSVLDIVVKHLIRPAKSFWVQDDCNLCGICAQVCPTSNVTLNYDHKPVWGNHCTNCLACFNWCPRQAIEMRKRPTDKKRYHHPEVTADEISGFRN